MSYITMTKEELQKEYALQTGVEYAVMNQKVEQLGLGADPAVIDKIKTALLKRFDFNSQGGATFLGPKKTVVKMHGCANEDTTVASIEQILRLENAGFCKEMEQALVKN